MKQTHWLDEWAAENGYTFEVASNGLKMFAKDKGPTMSKKIKVRRKDLIKLADHLQELIWAKNNFGDYYVPSDSSELRTAVSNYNLVSEILEGTR